MLNEVSINGVLSSTYSFGGINVVKRRSRRKKVSFTVTKRVLKKVDVSFATSKGKKVSFEATKKVPKKVKVEFYAKRKKK